MEMKMEKISAVYQIVNTVTGDIYVGSSKNVKHRWACHKTPSRWKEHPNSPMYKDFQKYGLENFRFQILASVEAEHLTQVEQEFVEMLNPTYNSKNAKGRDVERYKGARRKAQRKYYNQLCCYNGETLRLSVLSARLFRAGIEHPYAEAKKYLINN